MKTNIQHIIGILIGSLLFTYAQEGTPQAVSLFDGQTLSGWKVLNESHHAKYWSVTDGTIQCSSGGEKMKPTTFLYSEKAYEDFIFTCKFRITGDYSTGLVNSGIQYRSIVEQAKPHKHWRIVGYQADIGRGWWGGIYDEHRRGNIYKVDAKALLQSAFKEDAWHTYRIVCKGDNHKLYINGILTADYVEEDETIPSKGHFALQLHGGGICQIQYKDIKIIEL